MSTQAKTFVLSDNSKINSKGYKIDLNGLDISRFTNNPVMLYEHNPERVIGRWINLQKNFTQLTANPEFDTDDPEALQIAGKVERGFLNAASIGIIVHEMDNINGVDIVTKSELFEASIVSVPADSGAVRLYNKKLECLSIDKLKLTLSKPKEPDYKENYKKICEALQLDEETEIETVLATLKKITKTKGETEIEEALNLDILTVSEYRLYLNQLQKGQTSVLSIIEEKKQDFKKTQNTQFLNLYTENSDKIITYLGVEGWAEIKHLGFTRVKKIVEALPERKYFSNMVKNTVAVYDLDWYRKHNPKALRDNPELYQNLLTSYNQQNKHNQQKSK
jgi:HK97 family phage prohead protease